MNRAARAAATLCALALADPAAAQPPAPAPEPANLRGESAQTRKRLAEIERRLAAGAVAGAAADLQRLLDEGGDELVSADGRRFVPARRAAHALLAKLPPDALKAHRARTDQPARALLERGTRDRDPRPLWALADRYPVSGPADEGLLLLGDLLFERGEFRTAEGVWRRLLPDGGAEVPYPGSAADPAGVRARVVLAAAFQGDPARARAELAAFKLKHPGASGALAGRTGPYADTLQAVLDARPRLPDDATAGPAWPTFGGAPDRAGRVPGGLPSFPPRPAWVRDLAAGPPGGAARPPFGHPLIVGGEVFVSNGARVLAFDRAGEPSRAAYSAVLPFGAAAGGGLTYAHGRLYARVGRAAVAPPEAKPNRAPADSFLVCLSLARPGHMDELWKLAPPDAERAPCAWEGPPLVSGRRVWAAYTKFDGGRAVQVLACYDPADAADAPARPAWTVELCDAPHAGERPRQELLALAGRNVVFCSNSGAAVAVDAATGARAWGFRYPRGRKVPAPTGDPAPAVAHEGRVFLAPADGDRVYALDAETGRVLWESAPVEGARVLGVARERLVVAAAGPLRGIRALALDTGSHAEGGWVQADDDLLSSGQGLVADNLILWPTRKGLFRLDPATGNPRYGQPLTGPLGEPQFGHLASADGRLVAVTPTQLWVYEAQARPADPLPDAPRERHDALLDRAERAARAGDTPGALAALGAAAACDVPAPWRARAVARMLQLAPPAHDPARLPGAVRAALRPELLAEWVLPPDGVPVALGAFLDARLGRSPQPGTVPAPAEPPPAARPPAPGPEAELVHTVRLPPAVAPLAAIPGGPPATCAVCAGARAGVRVPFDRSAVRPFVPADLFTHAAELGGGFVAAGPFAVAVYEGAPEPVWVFRVPVTERLPDGPGGADPDPGGRGGPHLGSFALAGQWLVARAGERHLIALDLPGRRVAWVLGANGRAGYEPDQFPGAPRFGPELALVGRFVLVQRSNGTRWFVDARTGRPAVQPGLDGPTARAWWAVPPADLGDGRVLLPDGPGLVRLARLGDRVKWAYGAERASGLTGAPAHARAVGAALYVAVCRNHGVEFERIDPADGEPLWPNGPAFADADRIDLRAAAADATGLYVPAGNRLLAVCPDTGKVRWEADLPAARGWAVRAGEACVIAHPTEAVPVTDPGAALGRAARALAREPLVCRLPGLAATLYDACVTREVPVRLFDPDTGAPLRGFCVPATGPAVQAWFDAGALVVATGDRVVWIK